MEALLDHRLSPADLRILAALSSWRSSKDGFCHPSRANISKRCGGIEDRSVTRGIRRLENLGWVKLVKGGGRGLTNIYRIDTPQELISNPDADVIVSEKP